MYINIQGTDTGRHTLYRYVDSETSRLLKREAVMMAASTFMGRKAKTGMMKAITKATSRPVNTAVKPASTTISLSQIVHLKLPGPLLLAAAGSLAAVG